jgi:hypothetical protein
MRRVLAFSLTVIAMSVSSAYAAPVNEVEMNNTPTAAKSYSVYDIKAVMGDSLGGPKDADMFRITGKAGQTATIESKGLFKPNIAFFQCDASGNNCWKVSNPRPVSSDDVKASVTFKQDGDLFVGVVNALGSAGEVRAWDYFGNVSGTAPSTPQPYEVTVAGIVPPVMQITIAVKPGDTTTAPPINPNSNGKIPVALFGSKDFHPVTDVDMNSLRFGHSGTEASLSYPGKSKRPQCAWSGEDVDGDGILDLVCHFENQRAGFQVGDMEGKLTGQLKNGTLFEGHGTLKVLPVLND